MGGLLYRYQFDTSRCRCDTLGYHFRHCKPRVAHHGNAGKVTAGAVWALDSGWPDIVVAVVLLALFLRSALRVVGAA
jgi:hypothetical protein